MAKSGFKAAVRLVKTVNREINRAERESAKQQRRREMQFKKEVRDRERQTNLANKLAIADDKERAKAEITEAKEAYDYRCEERKLLREQIVNEEIR
jgi:hypothetical protein